MAYGCIRITQENEQLRDKNKNLELEVTRMKAVSDEHVKGKKALQEENSAYIATIATMKESKKQYIEKQNLRIKRLRDYVDEWDQEESVCCQFFPTFMLG
jgi:hypothetical protein